MNEEKLHFAELSKELKCITGFDGSVIYINTVGKKVLGYSPDELLAKSILDLVYLEDKAKTNKAISQLIEKKNILELKNRCICKNGTALHISWRANYVEQSKEIYWVGYNITAYKNTELVLLENGKKYENLIENMELGFAYGEIILDNEGLPYDYRFLQVNKAYEKQTGILASSIVGRCISEVFPDLEQSWIDILGKVALSRKPITFTNYSHLTDKYFETSFFSPVNGIIASIFNDVTDTEKEKTSLKQSLKQSEAFYEKVFDSMTEAFTICEVIVDENNKPVDYRHLAANLASEKHSGLKREEVIGRTVLEIFPDYESSWIERFGNVALTEESIEFTGYDKNTNRYYHVISFSPEKGKFAIMFRDVTEERQLKAALIEAKEKAEESDHLKSAFLANMSHEIRTPMNAILGFSSLLKNKNLNVEKKEAYLDLIEAGGKRLLTLISDILDISKIDANQLTIRQTAFSVNQLIDNLQAQFAIQAADKANVILTKRALSDYNCTIKTDETRLTQILSNLLENANKFTNEGEIELGYAIEDDKVKFFVKDTGIGIAVEKQADIFKRFSQVNNEYSRVGKGTGIGLSIVKGLVELLNGEIWVESAINEGAKFYITLPYQPIPQNLTQATETDISLKKDKKIAILVAEDEESNYLLLEALLEEFDFKIIHAKNGKEAVEMTNKHHINLVLMDIKMPLMDGYEATRAIKKINKNLPIIAQTAYAMVEDRQKTLNAGCDDYISKPVSIDVLSEVLDKYL